MIHPAFSDSTDYNCLNPDLSGPKAMWEHREIERLVAGHEEDARKSKKQLLPTKEIRQLIEDEILEAKEQEKEIDAIAELQRVFNELQVIVNLRKRYGKSYQPALYRNLIGVIRAMYSAFDIDKFKKDFNKAYPSNRLSDDEKNYRKSVKDAEKARNDLEENYDWTQHFKMVPNTWRGSSKGTVGENEMAGKICRKFIDDWTERQGKFMYAVTINGVLIESLPPDKIKLWGEAWKMFGLDKIKRHEIFCYTLHGQGRAQAEPAPESIPREFHKVD